METARDMEITQGGMETRGDMETVRDTGRRGDMETSSSQEVSIEEATSQLDTSVEASESCSPDSTPKGEKRGDMRARQGDMRGRHGDMKERHGDMMGDMETETGRRVETRIPILERVRESSFARRADVQMCIFALCACMIIGPYNGLNALGGGGSSDHLLATQVSCVYALCLGLFGWVGGVVAATWGVRVVTGVGGVCYLGFVGVITATSYLDASPLWAFPAGVVVGIGACLLWSSFGTVTILYPPIQKQGPIFARIWAVLNLGGFSCGLLTLFDNYARSYANRPTTRMAGSTYMFFATSTVTGSTIAFIFLRSQDVRTSYTPIYPCIHTLTSCIHTPTSCTHPLLHPHTLSCIHTPSLASTHSILGGRKWSRKTGQ